MRKAQVLAELQQLDSALDRERERLALVLAQLEDRSALAAAESAQESARVVLQTKFGEQRDLELEVQDLRGKLTAVEQKLYGGSVRNPKELEALAQDAQQFRGLISTREDRLLELYDLIEQDERELAEAQSTLDAAQSAFDAGQQNLTAERDQLQSSIARHEAGRESTRAESDANSLRIYEGLRRSRAGLAVAPVSQRTCQGCRVSLPVNEEHRVRASEELVFCQSCGRILIPGA